MKVAETVNTAFSDLLEACGNPRQRTSLERIRAACDYLEANNISVTPSAIESYCLDRNWDGPKAQSIRNSKYVLKRYVDLRRAGQDIRPNLKRKVLEPVIQDESLKAYFRLLKEERDQALADRARIESGLRNIPGVPVDDLLRGKLSKDAKMLSSPNAKTGAITLSTAVLLAVHALFDEAKLSSCGLEIFRDRIRNSATRNVLLEKAEVEALRALVSGTKS